RAVDEVPRAEGPLLSFDDQRRLSGEHEEVLLVDLPVVHGHELSGLDHIDVDPELGEVGVGTFKVADGRAALHVEPARRMGVEHVPALPPRDKPALSRLQPRLRNHLRSLSHPRTATQPASGGHRAAARLHLRGSSLSGNQREYVTTNHFGERLNGSNGEALVELPRESCCKSRKEVGPNCNSRRQPEKSRAAAGQSFPDTRQGCAGSRDAGPFTPAALNAEGNREKTSERARQRCRDLYVVRIGTGWRRRGVPHLLHPVPVEEGKGNRPSDDRDKADQIGALDVAVRRSLRLISPARPWLMSVRPSPRRHPPMTSPADRERLARGYRPRVYLRKQARAFWRMQRRSRSAERGA